MIFLFYFCELEIWMILNWCFWIVILEKTRESLGCLGIQPVNPKGNQPWIFIGRSDAEAEDPILWPPDTKRRLIRKDPDAGQEQKGATEDEVGWHHWFNGHELEQTLRDREGQGTLACCSTRGHKCWTQLCNWTKTTNTTTIQVKSTNPGCQLSQCPSAGNIPFTALLKTLELDSAHIMHA